MDLRQSSANPWAVPLTTLLGLAAAGWITISQASAPPLPRLAPPYAGDDVFADTWVATDGLNRKLPGYLECGAPRKDKWVGIFYWTWHTPRPGPFDNTKLIAQAEAQGSSKVAWPSGHHDQHWGEPELGYYRMTDPFVIRKHAAMLANAGVDVVLFDTTNPPFTWKDEYEALCREYAAMRQEGARTPSIAFIAPFGPPRAVTDALWRDLYQPGLWQDLWFNWEGKPLLLANPDEIHNPAMREFFTFRRPMPDYWDGPSGPGQWSWLEVYPQHVFTNSAGQPEQMSVGVGQNALPNTPGPAPMSHRKGAMGRSWHGGAKDLRPGAVNHGFNFEEQWQRAIMVDPRFIFVTGWNEWTAGRFTQWSGYHEKDCYYPGGLFVDQYTQEYSRDCEPMLGGHTDNYYYQLAAWVRRFKGVRQQPSASGPSAIRIDGTFNDWASVKPEFRDRIGDVTHREHPGYGELTYRNKTGRNDFVILKAAYDRRNLYFYAQTRQAITAPEGEHWMLLLIDADQNAATGWLGYDLVVNHEVTSEIETVVHRWDAGKWQRAGKGKLRVNGNAMELSFPRALLQQKAGEPVFDFHWADNIQKFGDISELGVNGDSAPDRRANYRFQVKAR